MDDETDQTIPETLELREIRFPVTTPGSRTITITIATTLTNAKIYTKADIAQLYRLRWTSGFDIRDTKQTLHLNHVRCHSPALVYEELWTTLLGYNLVRTTTAAAALIHNLKPSPLSFTGACHYVLSASTRSADPHSNDAQGTAQCFRLLEHLANCHVANRPHRLEPRVIKRRRHHYALLQEPRQILKARLLGGKEMK